MNNCCEKCSGFQSKVHGIMPPCATVMDCPCHYQPAESWEEEFDKTFLTPAGHVRYLKGGNYYTAPKEIKSFITNLLSRTKEEAVAGERKRILEVLDNYWEGLIFVPHPQETYRQIRSLLTPPPSQEK